MNAAWVRLSPCTVNSALDATGASPMNVRASPDDDHDEHARDEEVGGDREGLARLAHAAEVHAAMRTRTNPTAISTRQAFSPGMAEMMLSTPEATDTATVRT